MMKKKYGYIIRLMHLIAFVVLELLTLVIALATAFVLVHYEILFGWMASINLASYHVCHILIAALLLMTCIHIGFKVFMSCCLRYNYMSEFRFTLKRIKLGDGQSVPTDHGDTLADVVRGFRKEKCEHFAAFLPGKGKIVECTSYDPTGVKNNHSKWIDKVGNDGCITIHNHPDGPTPFSHPDIAQAIACRSARDLVVAGDMVYELVLTEDVWNIDWLEVYDYGEKLFKAMPLRLSYKRNVDNMLRVNEQMAEKYGYVFHAWTLEDFIHSLDQ